MFIVYNVIEFYVGFAAPSAVEGFAISDIKATQVTLNWEEPKKKNGIITGYSILYSGITAVS